MKRMRVRVTALLAAVIVAAASAPAALALDRNELSRNANAALKNLYATNSTAKMRSAVRR